MYRSVTKWNAAFPPVKLSLHRLIESVFSVAL
jgi:hypothetical protein